MSEEKKFVLSAPEPVAVVEKEQAAGLVPLSPEQQRQLDEQADAFIAQLMTLDENSPDFGKKVDQLTRMGRSEVNAAAEHSSRFLSRPMKAMDTDGGVGADIASLRRTIEELDPKTRGNLLAPRKLLGVIPFGNKLRSYFLEYRSAQSNINAILERLDGGKDELLQDNAAIDVERRALWDSMGKLEEMVHIARVLDRKLEEMATSLDATQPTKARSLREGPLFSIRQRTTDLLTQMAVSVQGYLALDLVKKNNTELIKGVDRASTTTVAALRTAVTVAQAMTNQQLVLSQVTALNSTTANIIESTSEMLKTQTAQIHEQAAASTIPIETLQKAFDNIYQTMDAIDEFKLSALGSMKSTVEVLGSEVEKSRGYIARAEGAAASEPNEEAFRLSK